MDFSIGKDRLINKLSAQITDKRVIAAMARVPRERFVLPGMQDAAYDDKPLPIGQGQTISQPYIIALMTQELELRGTEKVLEVGTGSGYQAAVLAELTRYVVTVERLEKLAERAVLLLKELGYNNIETHLAEEKLGWQKGSPYDAIIVTAGAPSIPEGLIDQLADGGRMVVPVGTRFVQELYKITKQGKGNKVECLGACYFVSLIGEDAWQE